MLKYIIAVILIALAWGSAIAFDAVPMWAAGVATAVVVLGLGVLVLIKVLAARKSGQELESALDRQARAQASGARPERQAEIEAMQAEFDKAIRSLKGSRLGRKGGNPLHALPWYVIVGPPGCGKSTLLRNSGLKFPYLSKKRGGVKGVGGTRNCDWWLTNEAILLDTAGRWSVEDDDAEEWLAFLDLLKKTRRGRSLNGVLVAIGVEQLVGASEESIAELAHKLRERVDEITQRLGMILPTYLLVTKCDLIAGFVETFGHLKDDERGQIWGFTLPLDMSAEERADVFVDRLDEILDVLEMGGLDRLGNERRADVRRRIYEFPQQFEEICPKIVGLANELCAEDPYREAPILRGVYFTSGTQEGRPIDLVMQQMAEAFGIAPRLEGPVEGKAKSYFLRDVFQKVLFPDQDVGIISLDTARRHRTKGLALAGVAVLGAASLVMAPVVAYSRNRSLAEHVRTFATALHQSRNADGLAADAARLEALEGISLRLHELADEGPTTSMGLGFYEGDRLLPAAAVAVMRNLVEPLIAEQARSLAAYAAGRPAPGKDAVGALRTYLLLTGPKPGCGDGCCEPRGPEDKAWQNLRPEVETNLVEGWRALASRRGPAPSAMALDVVRRSVGLYLRFVGEDGVRWGVREDTLVAQVRDRLARDRARQDSLDLVVRDPAFDELGIDLARELGGSVTLFQDMKGGAIPGAFTRQGFRVVEANLKRLAEGDGSSCGDNAWVGGPGLRLTEEQVAGLRTTYFDRYGAAWRGALSKIYPTCPQGFPDAQIKFAQHTSEKPLAAIFSLVSANFDFADEPGALGSLGAKGKKLAAAVDKIEAATGADRDPDVEKLRKDFEPFLAFGIPPREGSGATPLDTYYEKLGQLSEAVTAYSDAPDDSKALREKAKAIEQDLRLLTNRVQGGRWGQVIEKMLVPPVTCTVVMGVEAGAAAMNRKWCDLVVVEFDQFLRGRYPMARDGTDAAVEDVERFLKPDGVLWQFVGDALKNDVEKVGRRYRVKDNGTVALRKEFVSFLEKASRLGEVLFDRSSPTLQMPLEVRVLPGEMPGGFIRQITVALGAGRAVQRNTGEVWEKIPWPASDLRLEVSGTKAGRPVLDQREFSGPWALWKLLDASRVSGHAEAEQYVHLELGTTKEKASLKLDLKPRSIYGLFDGFALPRAVAPGEGCGR